MLSIKFAGFSGNRVGLVNVAEEKIITITKKKKYSSRWIRKSLGEACDSLICLVL